MSITNNINSITQYDNKNSYLYLSPISTSFAASSSFCFCLDSYDVPRFFNLLSSFSASAKVSLSNFPLFLACSNFAHASFFVNRGTLVGWIGLAPCPNRKVRAVCLWHQYDHVFLGALPVVVWSCFTLGKCEGRVRWTCVWQDEWDDGNLWVKKETLETVPYMVHWEDCCRLLITTNHLLHASSIICVLERTAKKTG